jgi:hypothetical protein
MNGALDGERVVAMRSPSDRRSCILSALSSIWSFMYSGVVGIDGMVVLLCILSVARTKVGEVNAYTRGGLFCCSPHFLRSLSKYQVAYRKSEIEWACLFRVWSYGFECSRVVVKEWDV